MLWVIQLVNASLHYQLNLDGGIRPRVVDDLWRIGSAPFLATQADIASNSLPLLILGFLAAYRGVSKYLWVSIIVLLTSGLMAWLTSPSNTYTVGFSGVIFGWFGYIVVRSIFSRRMLDIAIAVVVVAIYIPILTLVVPTAQVTGAHISWEDHIGGLVGGLCCGWLLWRRRDRGTEQRAISASRARSTGEPGMSPRAGTTAHHHGEIEADLQALRREVFGEGTDRTP